MQTLFKNTPISSFTEKRQAIFNQALNVINQTPELACLNPKANFLADLIPKLSIHHKALMPLLFNSFDLLWALHVDGCKILKEINKAGGFLYEYSRTDGDDFENIESPAVTLKYDGLQAIALGLSGVTPEQKGKALRDLILALAGINRSDFKQDFPQDYETKLYLSIDYNKRNPQPFDYKGTLAFKHRFTDEEKRKLGYMIHGYIEHLKNDGNEINGYGTIGSNLVAAYCYNYACQMKMNDLANNDIIYNLETVIIYLIEALGVRIENTSIYSRLLLVNSCTPFIDLLKAIDAKDYELSAGMCLPVLNDEPMIKILSRHHSGVLFMLEHIKFMPNNIVLLEDNGYQFKLEHAIKNPLATTHALSTLLKKESEDSLLIDSILEKDNVPFHLYRAIMESADYSRISTHGLAKLYITACRNYEVKIGEMTEKTAHDHFRKKIFKREAEKEIGRLNDFLGKNWKAKILPIVDEMGKIDILQ